MFIRFSYRVKRAVTKHQKISLCLGYVAFLILLTTIAYFMPKVAMIVWGAIVVITLLLLLMGKLCSMYDCRSTGIFCRFLAMIGVIFVIVIAVELKLFHG